MKRLLPLLVAVAAGCETEHGLTADWHKEQGDYYYQRGKWDQAGHEYELAIEKDDELYEAYIGIAYACRAKGQQEMLANPNIVGKRRADTLYRRGEEWAQKCLEFDEGNAEAMHVIGLLRFDAMQYDKALDWFDKALDHDPRHPHAHYYRSWCFFSQAVNLRGEAEAAREQKDEEKAAQLNADAGRKYAAAAKAMETYLENFEKTRNLDEPREAELRTWIAILKDLQSHEGDLSPEGKQLSARIKATEPQPEVREKPAPDEEQPVIHE